MTRDERGRSRPPLKAGDAARRLIDTVAPDTPLGSVQVVWAGAVGEAIAAVTSIAGERDGVLEVTCESSVWAGELSMMEPEIRRKLNDLLGDPGIESIKFRSGR